MHMISLHILKRVAQQGEVPLSEVLAMASGRHSDHRGQYPLALLLEEGYLGVTFNHQPPAGGAEMREFSLAISLHMLALPATPNSPKRYLGVESFGNMNADDQRVFLKAKGALYLDEQTKKFQDRIWSFALGFCRWAPASAFSSLVQALVEINLKEAPYCSVPRSCLSSFN